MLLLTVQSAAVDQDATSEGGTSILWRSAAGVLTGFHQRPQLQAGLFEAQLVPEICASHWGCFSEIRLMN